MHDPVVVAVLALGGLVFLGLALFELGRLLTYAATPTTAPEDVREPGYYEVTGRATASSPLALPATEDEAVYYRCSVYGWQTFHTRHGRHNSFTLLRTDENFSPFTVESDSGALAVFPYGARWTAGVTFEKPDEGEPRPAPPLVLQWLRSLWQWVPFFHRGYVQVEGIRVGDPVYVIGKVELRGGVPTMVEGDEEGRPFVISGVDEATLSARSRRRVAAYGLLALLLGGAALYGLAAG